jgi:hypothetical protein
MHGAPHKKLSARYARDSQDGPAPRDKCPLAASGFDAAAETLDDLVNFYNATFDLHLTDQEHDDLVAFLLAL